MSRVGDKSPRLHVPASPRPPSPAPVLGEDSGRPAILVDGVVQSVHPDVAAEGYWGAMLPDARPGAALLLGLGGGTLAQLLARRFGPVPMVGVDDDPRIITLGRAALGMGLPGLEIVVQDAFAYVAQCRRRFDLVCVDLYRGNEMPRQVLSKPFLRRLRELLRPRGLAVFNLMVNRRSPDQAHRLGQVFHVLEQVNVEANLVVFCRGR